MIDERKVFEGHAVYGGKGSPTGWVDVKETSDDEVEIGLRGVVLRMNADTAFRLATMLRRCARRAQERAAK